jgi:hypothetical protein
MSERSAAASRENGKKGGRPKGTRGKGTLDKIEARNHIRQRVSAELDELLDAQIANAEGIKYLVTRDKHTGKFIRVGAAMASMSNEETIEVWEKDPNVAAFAYLLNQAFDKPAEQPIEVDVRSEVEAGAALNRIKERARRLELEREAAGLLAGSNGHGEKPVS